MEEKKGSLSASQSSLWPQLYIQLNFSERSSAIVKIESVLVEVADVSRKLLEVLLWLEEH